MNTGSQQKKNSIDLKQLHMGINLPHLSTLGIIISLLFHLNGQAFEILLIILDKTELPMAALL